MHQLFHFHFCNTLARMSCSLSIFTYPNLARDPICCCSSWRSCPHTYRAIQTIPWPHTGHCVYSMHSGRSASSFWSPLRGVLLNLNFRHFPTFALSFSLSALMMMLTIRCVWNTRPPSKLAHCTHSFTRGPMGHVAQQERLKWLRMTL